MKRQQEALGWKTRWADGQPNHNSRPTRGPSMNEKTHPCTRKPISYLVEGQCGKGHQGTQGGLARLGTRGFSWKALDCSLQLTS